MESGYFYPLFSVLASLLLVYLSFRYFIYYRGMIAAKVGDEDKNQRLLRTAQVFLVVSSVAFSGSLVNLYSLSDTAIPLPATSTATLALGEGVDLSNPGAGQTPPVPGTISPLVSTLLPESSATPEVVPGTGFALIGNTNGFGVYVRTQPGLEFEMLTQLPDGSRVELTGEAQTADGFAWQRVRLEDGRLGWIADNFLIPEP